jgi:hypothetical protein
MSAIALLGTTLGLGFTAGLNLYATVFVTGLAVRLGWLTLPPQFAGLAVLSHPAVLVVAGVLYVVEFAADKVPVVEHAWDAVHTIIRPLGAIWLGWAALAGTQVSEPAEVAIVLLAGGVALSTHLGKAGSRVVATASGGHLFGLNTAVSLVEDLVTFVVAPLAIAHPLAALTVAVVCLAGVFWLAAKGWRWLRGTARQPAA